MIQTIKRKEFTIRKGKGNPHDREDSRYNWVVDRIAPGRITQDYFASRELAREWVRAQKKIKGCHSGKTDNLILMRA
jgi:hypothetical protein